MWLFWLAGRKRMATMKPIIQAAFDKAYVGVVKQGRKSATTNTCLYRCIINDAYEIVGYANTIAEAQVKLYGRSYTDSKE
jgi:hypothetical protein